MLLAKVSTSLVKCGDIASTLHVQCVGAPQGYNQIALSSILFPLLLKYLGPRAVVRFLLPLLGPLLGMADYVQGQDNLVLASGFAVEAVSAGAKTFPLGEGYTILDTLPVSYYTPDLPLT